MRHEELELLAFALFTFVPGLAALFAALKGRALWGWIVAALIGAGAFAAALWWALLAARPHAGLELLGPLVTIFWCLVMLALTIAAIFIGRAIARRRAL